MKKRTHWRAPPGTTLQHWLWMVVIASLSGSCATSTSTPATKAPISLTPTPLTEPAVSASAENKPTTTIKSIEFEKSFFLPGQSAAWTVTLSAEVPADATLVSKITFLDQTLSEDRKELSLQPGEMQIQNSWDPPAEAPRGYGLDIRVESSQGEILASRSSAFDVLEIWTQNPRYGFLTNFGPDRQDPEVTLNILKHFHINGLQFYDWMYLHDEYLAPTRSYKNPLGRLTSLDVMEGLIDVAHKNGMAAMAYTTAYAASSTFFERHKDWGIYQSDGQPAAFGGTFLYIMDPRPDSPWTRYLLDQFSQILTKTQFDGIHIDQFGDPKAGYDAQGNYFALDQPLVELINSTAAIVRQARGEKGTTIFNAVNAWPIQAVAPSQEDLVYIEVWPPNIHFNDFFWIINQAQNLGAGKPVVIAAYINPAFEVNALLNDAIIFASGAGHIELGENGRYLADPYFPNYKIPSDELSAALQRYYEFAIRYQNIIGPATSPGSLAEIQNVSIAGTDTNPQNFANKVMPIIRKSDGYTALSLVNLLGLQDGLWRENVPEPPEALQNAVVTISDVTEEIPNVWFASPDGNDLSLQTLAFQQNGNTLTFTVPSLYYWTLILIKQK